jgi:aspartyl-tRNA(Asn)/glutamyl-tRNA(Gln) amidotransferase subunit A
VNARPSDILARLFAGAESPSAAAAVVAERLTTGTGNALIASDLERLAREARAADERIAAGEARPLEGLPVVLKDNIGLAGFEVTAGTRAGIERPQGDARISETLIAAGAIPYAKANMTELALRGHGRNAHFGDVAAPGAPGYLAGGSSSGSAAAVKLGLAAFAVGTDTAGSVRMPAAACGVVGYKPAHGEFPLDGVVPLSQTCDHIGFLAAGVDVIEAVLEGLGHGPTGPPGTSADSAPDAAGASTTGEGELDVRLFAPSDEAMGPLDPDQRRAFERAAVLLGAEPAPAGLADRRFFDEAAEVYHHVRAFEAVANFGAAVERGAGLEPETVATFADFAEVTEQQYRAGLERRAAMREQMIAGLGREALLILPTMSILAPPATATEVTLEGVTLPLHVAMIRLPLPFSLLGLPTLALPAGPARDGLTASVQLVAAPGNEAKLLAAARRLESKLAT